MSGIKRFLLSALLLSLAGRAVLRAAEFEVLDRFSVDGYTVLRGSAAIPGGSFAVGGSTFAVRDGKVGIGTAVPASKLDVAGGVAIGAAYSGTSSAPANGLLVEGNVGIGTTSPAASLDVNGGIKVGTVTTSCTSNIAGTLRWYDGHISVCNGSAWRQLDNQPPPTFTSITPASGLFSGGTAITIAGTGFNQGLELTIGGAPATTIVLTGATQITAVTPAGAAGAREVKITNSDGQYITGSFTYNPLPTITGITPASGSGLGGTPVTITGTGFISGVPRVTIGANDATSVSRISDTQITAITPANTASGVKTVTIINSDTGSAANSSPGFTYLVYATGGAVTIVGSYRIHTFTTSGTISFATGGDIDYLVVAGGGGGGGTAGYSGGGGAGGFKSGALAVTAGDKTVTVGTGGAVGANGNNSVFETITSNGGGRGGTSVAGADGGSGGGGGHSSNPGGSGIAGQGYRGGTGYNSTSASAGGGGGAGGVGADGVINSNGAAGGVGAQSSISGTPLYYGGGGGGGVEHSSYSGGPGGSGGGGAGGNHYSQIGGGNGTANTGGGGGGGYGTATGAGGSGIVIIRYLK